ncbi:ABC transporter substrate-binding protein [Pseudarthrobacter sp. SSS035]|uniref:ABC transporter substrate-binding protein n=1 Tax=Pseudarthrobacter sp. SSS035 TaxID=2931399 RepID=UPI00201055C8|nr:extracellular solute-binding protein [Pseudarthrobacter sp. SSS035]
MKKIQMLPIAACAAALTLALTACTGAAPTPSGDGKAKEIRYLIAQPETTEQLELIKTDMKNFEEVSGISVKLDVLPNDNLQTILQTQLQSGDGPDVFDYGTGPGFAGILADAGLLYDLTDAYKTRDWKIYDFAKSRATFSGKTFGVPANVEEVGVFYNKDIFSKLGLSEPRNLDDLKKSAAKIKDAGIIPFAVSDKEGWQGGHLLSMALSSRAGSKGMSDLLNGTTPWTSPDVVAALETWNDLNKSAYLPPSPAAVAYDAANTLFYSGKAAMNPTGGWLVSGIEKNANFDAGFMPFPSESDEGIFSGGLGSGTFVSAKTTKVDAALKFLDYLQSAERGRWQVENLHTIPAFPVDTNGIKASPLFAQVISGTTEITKGTGEFGYNIDVLTTESFNKVMWDGFQGLLTGQKSSEQVAQELQTAFEKSAAESK